MALGARIILPVDFYQVTVTMGTYCVAGQCCVDRLNIFMAKGAGFFLNFTFMDFMDRSVMAFCAQGYFYGFLIAMAVHAIHSFVCMYDMRGLSMTLFTIHIFCR